MKPAANIISKCIQRQMIPKPEIPDGLYMAYVARVVNINDSPHTNECPVVGTPVSPTPQASTSFFLGNIPRQTPPSTDIAYKLERYATLSGIEKTQLFEQVIIQSDEITRRMAEHKTRVLTVSRAPKSAPGDSDFASDTKAPDVTNILVETQILNNRAELAKKVIRQRTLSWKNDSK